MQGRGLEVLGGSQATANAKVETVAREDIVRVIIMVQLHTVLGVSLVPSDNGLASRWREV